MFVCMCRGQRATSAVILRYVVGFLETGSLISLAMTGNLRDLHMSVSPSLGS